MADDVAITPGSGAAIATDDCSGRHVQIIKLAVSADGSATLIPAEATNGLDVDVTRLPALVAGTAKIGTVSLENTNATLNSTSSDGGTALTSTAQAIKASAGKLKGYYIYNPNAAAAYVQFYNTAQGSVTVGTTNPLFMLTLPPASAANLWMESGVNFSTAMSWSATSTAGGNGAPTTALDAVAWYE
jgi:hypothetical protein